MGAVLKYLLLALAVVWLLYSPAVRGRLRDQSDRRARNGKSPEQPSQPDGTGRRATAAPKADRIEPCAHCGVHLPLADALHDIGGRVYCSEAHLAAGPRH